MQPALVLALALPIGCFLSPTQAVQRSPQGQTQRDAFPIPKEGLKLSPATAESAMSLAELTNEFSRVTGETLVIDAQARQVLQQTVVGLNRAIDVPPSDVYFVVETMLVQNGFVLSRLNDREPRMLALYTTSMQSPSLTPRAVLVPVESLGDWARHPAFLVTTSIDLPNTDVRTMANSMRTMFTNGNVQQMIPVGNSSTMMITSFAPDVAGILAVMREIDAASARDRERRAKEAADRPAPKPETPTEKAKD